MDGIEISGQHVDLTEALTAHVREKIGKVLRHLDQPPSSCNVVLSVEKNRNTTEVRIHARQHDFFAKSEEGDMYAAIDSAAGKIDRQIKDLKHKRQSRRS